MARPYRRLQFDFGLTLEDYEKMSDSQGGLCAICCKPETATQLGVLKRLSVDHDHKTGKVRALLCMKCNLAIGYADDNIELMEKAIQYIRRFQ